MPASKDINSYTNRWMDLFNLMEDDPQKEVVIECGTIKEAKRLRLEFYKARAALLEKESVNKEEMERGMLSKQDYEDCCHPNLIKKEVLINGTNVVFGYREKSRIADLLQQGLEKYKETPHEND